MKRVAFLYLGIMFALMAKTTVAQQPVVFGVLFFSPHCGHCHYVINEHLPLWQKEFGEQLKLLLVDVTTSQGEALFLAAAETPGITLTGFGVPTLIIGTDVLVGSLDIPQRAPGLIRDGLAAGGIDLPPIAGLQDVLNTQLTEPVSPPSAVSDPSPADEAANILGIGVLFALAFSATLALLDVLNWNRPGRVPAWLRGRLTWLFALAASLGATALTATLLIQMPDGALLLLTSGITLALVIESVGIAACWLRVVRNEKPNAWLIPLAALAGLAIAVYLAYIELTQSQAYCGLVGDCNTVQQSAYARLFGVLPIGVLGVIGYVGILLAWLASRALNAYLAKSAWVLLRGMSLFGVVFSIYLTYLEPFVIGATCIWCLTSAVIMLLLLWLILLEASYTPGPVPKQSTGRSFLHSR